MFKISFDPAKNERNILERRLPFSLVQHFEWDSALIVPDDRWNYGEPRFRALGYLLGRLHVLVYTPRFPAIHVISLRKANQREVRLHDQETQARHAR